MQSTRTPQADLPAKVMEAGDHDSLRVHHSGAGTLWFLIEQSPRHGKISAPQTASAEVIA
jgi:hypothetical protein